MKVNALVLVAALAALCASSVHAQGAVAANEDRARELFSAGRAALDVGRPEQARSLLAESLALAPNAGAAFNLSLVHIELGQMVAAKALLLRLLSEEYGRIADEQRSIVESKLALTESAIAHVRVVVEGSPIELSLDGESQGVAENGQEFILDEGSHVFVGRRGAASARVEREFEGGARSEVHLQPVDEAALQREIEAQEDRRVRRRRRRWALSLTAIVVLAAGAVTAGVLLQPQPVGIQDPVYGNTQTLGFRF